MAAERECTWSASAEGQWLTLRSGSTGQGNGTVEFTAARNPDPVARRGAIVLNEQRAELTQAAADCVITLAQSAMSFGQSGGSGRVEVRASSDLCTWRAESDSSWIALRSDANGKGSTPVLFEVMPSSGPTRRGAIRVAGLQFEITQTQGCSYTINPSSFAAAPTGGSGTTAIATGPGCAWTAVSGVNWLTVTPAAGEGPGAVSFTVAPSGGTQRSGTAQIAGQTFTVTQSEGCAFDVNPLTHSVSSAGGTVSVTVGTGSTCPWSIASSVPWITFNGQPSRTGAGTVELIAASTIAGARSGTVAIAGRTVTINQAGACSLSISPQSAEVPAAGGSGKVSVNGTGGCGWTAASNVAWIQVTAGASGSGNGEVSYTVLASSGAARSGTITIAGQTFTVTQPAPLSCSFQVEPLSIEVNEDRRSEDIKVKTAQACVWTVTSNASWLRIAGSPNRIGSDEVRVQIDRNEASTERKGTLTVAGQTVTVTQRGEKKKDN